MPSIIQSCSKLGYQLKYIKYCWSPDLMFQSTIQRGLAFINYQNPCFYLAVNTQFAITNYLDNHSHHLHLNSVNMWLTTTNFYDNYSHRGLHFVLSLQMHLPGYPLAAWRISYQTYGCHDNVESVANLSSQQCTNFNVMGL